jgi:DNA-binding SARP family transcriptional activator
MDFRILGSLEVWDGERQLELGGPKRRAVLAYLLLHANEVVGVDRLVDQLWGEKAPRNAAAALHSHVSRLRKELGPDLIATRAWGYVLRSEPGALDLERFQRFVGEGENLPARERAAKLRQALALWRGAPLEDLAGEPALQADIGELEELRLAVLESRIDADLEAGQHNGIIGELETLIAEHPLRERLRGQLILALYRSGRQAEALEVYRETRRVLAEELGLEPSPELRELERAILQHDPGLRPALPATAPVTESGVRPGRRRRLYIGAAALIVLVAAGTALALSSGGGHVAQPPLSPGKRVTHHRAKTVTLPGKHPSTPQTGSAAPPKAKSNPHTKTVIVLQRPAPSPLEPTTTAPAIQPRPATTTPKTATTTIPAKPAPPPTSTRPATPVTVSDTFDGNQIDGTIWYLIRFGTGWDMTEQNGRLEFSFSPKSAPGPPNGNFGGLVGTQCKFPGDFDARVDFTLVDWPAGNGITVTLNAFLGPTNIGWQSWRRSSAQWGEAYGSYTGTSASVALNDAVGTLRIARDNGTITAYFLHNGAWDAITSGQNAGLATIAVSANGGPGYNVGPFIGQQVTVDFDNFTVTATNPTCPPGSQPHNP